MNSNRSPALSAPYVARDAFSKPLRHPVTGNMVDSKAEFRRMTRDAGCVEIGDADLKPSRPATEAPDKSVATAVAMLRQGYQPNPLLKAEFDRDG